MEKKELLFLITEVERTLRINNSYILGTNLSKKKYKELKKDFLNIRDFNHFEVENLLTVLFYYRNYLLYENDQISRTFLSNKYYKNILNLDKKKPINEVDILNIALFFIPEDLAKHFTSDFLYNNLSKYSYTKERFDFFNEKFSFKYNLRDEKTRRLRNFILHGYSSGEINRDGFTF